jgi:hypothetical protein
MITIDDLRAKFANISDADLIALYQTYKNLQSRGIADEITENVLFDELLDRNIDPD